MALGPVPKRAASRTAAATAAADWFSLPTPDIDAALKTDLRLLALRGALDPTRHYRRADSTKLRKQFHIGTVVEGPADYYSARLDKRHRGVSLADELLRDEGAAAVRRKRYGALQAAGAAATRGAKRKTGLPRERAKAKRPKH